MKTLICFLFLAMMLSCGSSQTITTDDDDTVDIGYGSVKKKHNTTAATQLNVDNNVVSRYHDIFDYIAANVPGVMIVRNNNETPRIIIRGIKTILGNSDPLIMVDGVETNDISTISITEVGYISVLKGAECSAYGARGANGVILIRTKR